MLEHKILRINFLAGLLFLIDILVKRILFINPNFYQGLFFNFFFIKFYKNKEIAFGLSFPTVLIYILIGLILIILVIFLIKSYVKRNYFQIFALSLIILGTISNLADRIFYGYVIDYLNFSFFPVFNLADLMIVVGAGLIMIRQIKKQGTK